MMRSYVQSQWAGLRVRPACLYSLLVVLFVTFAVPAQKSKETRAINSLLGVSIGSTLEEARTTLTPLGTGGGRDTRDGGRKEAWTLKGTDYANIAFKTDGKGRVVWVSAFTRSGKEIPFSKLGDLSKSTQAPGSAVWNVETPQGGYRLVAKGANGKASVIYLLSLEFPEIQ